MSDPLLLPSKDDVNRAMEAVRDRCRWSASYVRRRRAVCVLAGLSDCVWDAINDYDDEVCGEEDEEAKAVVFEDRWSAGNVIQVSPTVTTVRMRGEEPFSLPTMHFGRMLQSLSHSWSDDLSSTEVVPEASEHEVRQLLLRWNDRERIIRAANACWRPLWMLRSRMERVRAAVYGGPHFYWDESLDPEYGDDARETDPYVLMVDSERAAWRWQGEERAISTKELLDELESLFFSWLRLAELPLRPASARTLQMSFTSVRGHRFPDGVFTASDSYAADRLRLLAKRDLEAALLEARERPPKAASTEARAARVSKITNDDPQLSLLAEEVLMLGGVDDQLWQVVRDLSPSWDETEDCWVITWHTAEGDELALPIEYDPAAFRDAETPPTKAVERMVERLRQRGWVCPEDVMVALHDSASAGQRHLELSLLPTGVAPEDD